MTDYRYIWQYFSSSKLRAIGKTGWSLLKKAAKTSRPRLKISAEKRSHRAKKAKPK